MAVHRLPVPRDHQHPALARCVRVTWREFAAEYWGRRPLLSGAADLSGRTAAFQDLMSVADVDELISRRGLRSPFLRMARDGRVLNPRDYTGPGGAGAQVADQALDERVLARFTDGATLVLQGLHRVWPPVGGFARTLAAELGHPVGVNGYLTPPEAQGFAAHYDSHDVFVLQVSGAKRWQVHRPVRDDPLPQQSGDIAAAAEGPPVLDTVLEPGDALYLPRGWVHSARSRRELTMHLTVGVFPVTRYALVQALLALAADHPELRRSLPLGVDPTDPSSLADELAETTRALTGLLREVDPAAVADRIRGTLWPQSRPAPIPPLAQASALRALGPDTRLARRGQLRWRLTGQESDEVVLHLFDRELRFPASWRPAVHAVLSGEVARVRDLPGLSAEDQVTLGRRLLKAAVVIPVERDPGR